MLDIKAVREDPERVKGRLRTRGDDAVTHLDEVLSLDQKRRRLLTEVQSLKSKRNQVSKEIGGLMAQKMQAEAEKKKAEMREVGHRIADLDKEVAAVEESSRELLLQVPNLPHESVPVGNSADENVEVRCWGERREYDFAPKTHMELCQDLGLVDFERAAKLAGSGYLLYTHWGARLERALITYLLDLHTSRHGYTEVNPPFLVNEKVMTGVGQFPKFRDQVYTVQEGEDSTSLGRYYLIPTAEAPVANLHREEILAADQLPLNYCAYTPCFRAEAGAAGVGTRGMIRVHQFDKVELIRIVKPENGYFALEELVGHAEYALQQLGLHYRVLLLCTGDMGFASAMTYDIEVWAPGQNQYLEVSSCSNCEDFQARRMNLRFKAETGKNRFPHILNGSGTALARLFVALLEQHQQPDGSVSIPAPLQTALHTDRLAPPRRGSG